MSRLKFRKTPFDMPAGNAANIGAFSDTRRLRNVEIGSRAGLGAAEETAIFRALGSATIAQAFDPNDATSGLAMATGSMYVVAIHVPVACSITGVSWGCSTARSGGTITLIKGGLLDATGTFLRASANNTSILNSTGRKDFDFTAPYDATPGVLYAAILATWSVAPGTVPQLAVKPTAVINTSDFTQPGVLSSAPRHAAATSKTDINADLDLTTTTLNTTIRWARFY